MLTITAVTVLLGGLFIAVSFLWRSQAADRCHHRARCWSHHGHRTARFPVWYALAGPSHFSGPIWSGADLSAEVNNLRDYLFPKPQNVSAFFGSSLNHLTGGYQGPVLSAQFIGVGALVVVVFGLVVWHPDGKLWLFSAVAVASVGQAVGVAKSLFKVLPVLQDVIAQRYMLATDFCLAILLGLLLDHVFQWIPERQRTSTGSIDGSADERTTRDPTR